MTQSRNLGFPLFLLLAFSVFQIYNEVKIVNENGVPTRTRLRIPGNNVTVPEKKQSVLPDAEEYQDDHDRASEAEKEGKEAPPYFVFHAGIPKAGSTTLQKDLKQTKLTEQLLQDRYIFLPHEMMHQQKSAIFQKEEDGLKLSLASSVQKYVENIEPSPLEKRYNLVGSSEYLFKPNERECQAWSKEFMEKQSYHMKIVLIYRRHHGFLPSVHNQYYKVLERVGKYWPGINGDVRIMSFEEWYECGREHEGQCRGSGIPNWNVFDIQTEKSYQSWKQCSHEIQLISLHHVHSSDSKVDNTNSNLSDRAIVNGLTIDFICDTLQGGRNETCQHYSQKADGEFSDVEEGKTATRRLKANTNTSKDLTATRRLKANTSKDLNHDIIAVYAYQNGYFTTEQKRKFERQDVVKAVEQHFLNNDISYQLKCPEQSMLDEIYNVSLKGEEWYFSIVENNNQGKNGLTEIQLEDFNVDWKKTVDAKTFCAVDVEEVFKNQQWKGFFRNLV